MNPDSGSLWIDTDAALQAFVEQVASSPWLAVDTEFLRERTYYPQLCLVQVSDGHHHALVDVQAELDLDPLLRLLHAGTSENVFHACLQDADALEHHCDFLLRSVFDTQVAWALLGRGYQSSYANLVSEVLGHDLDKSQSRSRWDRRPLSGTQIQYALLDVLYLGPVYETLHGELEQRGRLPWMQEEMERLLKPSNWTSDPAQAWRSVLRRVRDFPQEHLGALQVLAAWREHAARHRDIPRRWLIEDAVLATLAHSPPATQKDCRRLLGRRGADRSLCEELWKTLDEARNAEASRTTPISRTERIRRQERIGILRPQLDQVAEECSISRELLATRGMIEELVGGAEQPLLLQGWRGRLLGESLPGVAELAHAD